MKLNELDTPALVIDLDCMEDNLNRMAAYCREKNIGLRPHIKTHKTLGLAQRQVELGAYGITVAKIGEAEVMSDGGIDSMLLAYPVIGGHKVRRLAAVMERSRVVVSLDSEEAVGWVSQAAMGKPLDILVEVDFGMRRCGLPPGEKPVQLAKIIDARPELEFKGLMLYAGHLSPDLDGNTREVNRLNSELGRQLEMFVCERIDVSIVTGGSTPSAYYSHLIEGLTEIRPGTYIFNDRNTVEFGACSESQCAGSVLVTVVSTAVSGQAIVDGGSKTFSSDSLIPGNGIGHGIVKGYPEVVFTTMSEEHGYLQLPPEIKLEIGQQLQIIPNHICACVNMHDRVWGIRREEVVDEWEISARGRIR